VTVEQDFFRAYGTRFRNNWDVAVVPDVAAEQLREQQRVSSPGLERTAVMAYMNSARFPAAAAGTYVEFLAYAACRTLDCDGFVEFFRTDSFDAWRTNVDRARAGLESTLLFPLGFCAGTGAVFCLEASEPEPVVSIVDGFSILRRAFSSFGAMLSVLARLLSSRVVLYVEPGAEPDEDQRNLVRELIAADVSGFGAVGWPRWYQRLVGGTDW